MTTKPTPERVRLQRELRSVRKAMSQEREEPMPIVFPSLSSEREKLLAQIDAMKNEVTELETKIQEKQAKVGVPSRRVVMDSLISLNVKSFEREILSSSSTTAENDPNQMIKEVPPVLSSALCGFVFTKNENHLLPLKPGTNQLRRYNLEGKCRHIPFSLRFDVDETTTHTVAAVAQVPIEFRQDLEHLLFEVSQTKDINMFFRSMENFADLCDQRSRLIQFFKDQYPDEVSVARGVTCASDFHFTPRSPKSGFQFTFAWDIEVYERGTVFQSYEVIPRVSKEYIAEDKHCVILNLNRSFQQLVQLRGLRRALSILISAILNPES